MTETEHHLDGEAAEAGDLYCALREEGDEIRGLLWPLEILSPRERAVFTEYHYWKTHMRLVAKSHKISLGKIIKSKWIKTRTYTTAVNVTGVTYITWRAPTLWVRVF